MKPLILAASIVLLAAAAGLQVQPAAASERIAAAAFGGGEHVKGSGRVVEDRRALSGFTAVRLTGAIDLQLKASDRDAVLVRADDNVAPLIETRVTGGERPALEIGMASGASFRTARTPVVVVEFRTLSELVMRGSGDVRADRISAEDFAVSMSGSGDLRIEAMQAARLASVLSGSGDLVVSSGRAIEQAYRLSGSGDVSAGRLEGHRVQVRISGSGDAVVNASETLEATLTGSGDVAYRGDARVTQRTRGTGSVHKLR